MNINPTVLLGKRVLITFKIRPVYHDSKLQEFDVLEISPSGQNIKVVNSKCCEWLEVSAIADAEILPKKQ